MSAPDGWRRIVKRGNAEGRRSFDLGGLARGRTYYWSVQAIDSAFAGSAFAEEMPVSLNTPPQADDQFANLATSSR